MKLSESETRGKKSSGKKKKNKGEKKNYPPFVFQHDWPPRWAMRVGEGKKGRGRKRADGSNKKKNHRQRSEEER